MIHYTYDKSGRKGTEPEPIDILIGCPIQKREWIIAEWVRHVMSATKKAGLKPGFLFVMDPNEEPLSTMVHNQAMIKNVDLWVVEVEEAERADSRVWNSIRYERMVELRNLLLGAVREINPPLFLSLDSDILLHQDSLASMVHVLHDNDAGAVGGKAYMSHTGRTYPSYGRIGYQNNLQRTDSEGVLKVDVLMAIKLMTPAAFNVDYTYDGHGEDIGWSKACKEAGLSLYWDGTITNKHVMRPQDLTRIDVRAGF